ncbi:MAG: NAD-dependent DNA ligase LigA [Planctomycetota bacterium]|jgi:DNA ligase (NAD+)
MALKRPKSMSQTELRDWLAQTIQRANHLYYVDACPDLTDAEYDALLRELHELESEHPDLLLPDSPTQRVGGVARDDLAKVEHRVPMLSIENAMNAEEAEAWWQRTADDAGDGIELSAEPKYDGLSCELVYIDGLLTVASTRGDGKVGEEVTPNVKTIRSVPLRLNDSKRAIPPRLEVRGEVYIEKQAFAELNDRLEQDGLKTYVNPRNTASGSLRQLDAKKSAQRPLSAVWYQIANQNELELEDQAACVSALQDWGLVTSADLLKPTKLNLEVFKGSETLIAHYENYMKHRHDLPFEIDGMVVKVNQLSVQQDLGARSKSPRYFLAVKFPPEEAETICEKIDVQVGRTGACTPVAILKPVKVGGVTVTHATLHNGDEIDRLDLREGDSVDIHRAGDVIPQVLRVNMEKRPAKSKSFKMPTHCPECKAELVQVDDEVVIRCPNAVSCPAQVRGSFGHFVSRGAMNIEGLAEKNVVQLLQAELITDVASLYELHDKHDQMLELERWGQRKVDKLLKEIDKSRETTLEKMLYSFGIRNIGQTVSSNIADAMGSVENLMSVTADELNEVEGVGPIIAESLVDWLAKDSNRELMQRLAGHLKFKKAEGAAAGEGKLDGLTFVFTGSMNIGRKEAEELVKKHGGKASGSVSKKTSYLVAGDNAGSKLKKAQDLGVEVITEEDFQKMIS